MSKYLNKELYLKVCNTNFKEVLQRKGYVYFEKGNYNLNIIGVRAFVNDNKVTNIYDDLLIVEYKVNNNVNRQVIFPITTEPGLTSLNKLVNYKGCAILVPGQYRGCWKIGLHKGKYQALVQRKPVKVYRDKNLDDIYDLDAKTIEDGIFGINIHRSNENITGYNVNNWSAGCQVFSDPNDFNTFMRIVKNAEAIWGNSFTYTLIEEKDLNYDK